MLASARTGLGKRLVESTSDVDSEAVGWDGSSWMALTVVDEPEDPM